MSKVVVHLTNDSSLTLSDVELVADDVNDTIDQVPGGDAASVSKVLSTDNVTEAASGTGYNLELPTGLQKIIVARAKYRDPISNKIATYYGNAVVFVSDSLGEISIRMVALP